MSNSKPAPSTLTIRQDFWLYSRMGEVYYLGETIQDAADRIPEAVLVRLGDHLSRKWDGPVNIKIPAEFTIRGDKSGIIDADTIRAFRSGRESGWRTRLRFKRKQRESARYREDPVPGTGKMRGGCFNRKMRGTQEKRWNIAHQDLVHIRGRRKPCNLPDSWEDIARDEQRSWKKHRKTQWKVQKPSYRNPDKM